MSHSDAAAGGVGVGVGVGYRGSVRECVLC